MLNINSIFQWTHKCYIQAKKDHTSVCTSRSQLLFLAFKNIGYKPNLLRYKVNDNINNDNNLKLISGERFISHVVVELNKIIYDSNLQVTYLKEEYDKEINKINSKEVISKIYPIKIHKEELRDICDKCGLPSFFKP